MDQSDDYVISTDPERLDLEWIHRVLSTDAYWAVGRSPERVARSIEHSICYGLYDSDGRQVGFARLVTDRTVFAWLGDVYIDRSVRGSGLGKRLIAHVMREVDAMEVRRVVLGTNDADTLYRQFDFTDLGDEETTWMHRLKPGRT